MMEQPYLFIPFRTQDALAVARWKYEGIYAFYNQSMGRLVFSSMMRSLWSALGLELFSVVTNDSARSLVGLFTYTRQGRKIEIGLQMQPQHTGHGEGLAFVNAGLAFGRERYHPSAFTLYVAEFNERAIKVYERAGFRKVRRVQRTTEHGRTWHWEMDRNER